MLLSSSVNIFPSLTAKKEDLNEHMGRFFVYLVVYFFTFCVVVQVNVFVGCDFRTVVDEASNPSIHIVSLQFHYRLNFKNCILYFLPLFMACPFSGVATANHCFPF